MNTRGNSRRLETVPRVRVGVVAFGFQDDFFKETLASAERFADSVFVVYGRFEGFEAEYQPCPRWLRDWAQASPSRDLVLFDQKHSQHRQRDIYLRGMAPGDVLVVVDSDWAIRGAAVRRVFRTLRDSLAWDSLYFCERFPDPGERPQYHIGGYRFRAGWRHSSGQMLEDREGCLICGPRYRVFEVNPEAFHFMHFKISRGDPAYRAAQRDFWRRVNAER